MYKKKYVMFFLLIFILLINVEEINSQCSMCRAVLESEEGQTTAKGINNGILYLMAIPYLLVGFIGWKVIQMLKK